MNAAQFDLIYDEIITKRLQEQGYFKKGKSVFLQTGNTMATLLRSTFRGDQGVEVMFGIRHIFVRDYLHLKTDNPYLADPYDYPFQFAMFEFQKAELFSITPVHWKDKQGSYVYYGDVDFEDSTELRKDLELIYTNVSKFGPKLMNILSPKKSMEILENSLGDAWIEKTRLEDYKEFFAKGGK